MARSWRVLFAGSPEYAVPTLDALLRMPEIEIVGVLTQKPKPHGRGMQEHPSAVGEFAKAHNLLTLTPNSLRNAEVLALLRETQADCGVVVAYGKIFPQNILEIFPHGWINAHGSLLPRWRGASPIQHAVLAGDSTTGVTLMRIDAGMDTGPTFATDRLRIDENETSQTLASKLSQSSARLIQSELIPYLEGKRPLTPQPGEGITTAPLIAKGDGVLDFTLPAETLERQIRAYTSWPGSTCTIKGTTIKILQASVQPGSTVPGTCILLPNGFGIGTAQALLVPHSLQVVGKKAMSALAFRNGYPKLFQ